MDLYLRQRRKSSELFPENIHPIIISTLGGGKELLQVPVQRDILASNKLTHAIGKLYAFKESKQQLQTSGGRRKKKKSTKKALKTKRGGGLFSSLKNLVSPKQSDSTPVQPNPSSITSSFVNLTQKLTKSASKLVGVDPVSIGFYKTLEVIFHLTFKDMVNRLLENIFKSIFDNNKKDIIIHFFKKLHERNIIMHSIFMNTILFYLVNIHNTFTLTNVVDQFLSILLVSLSSVPTVHFLVSLRLAYNDIYYSTMKCTQSEIENIPILQKSKYILIEPPTPSEPESKIQESSLKIETLSDPTPASTVTFLKGKKFKSNSTIWNKFTFSVESIEIFFITFVFCSS